MQCFDSWQMHYIIKLLFYCRSFAYLHAYFVNVFFYKIRNVDKIKKVKKRKKDVFTSMTPEKRRAVAFWTDCRRLFDQSATDAVPFQGAVPACCAQMRFICVFIVCYSIFRCTVARALCWFSFCRWTAWHKFVLCFTRYGSQKAFKQQKWPSRSFKGIGSGAIR